MVEVVDQNRFTLFGAAIRQIIDPIGVLVLGSVGGDLQFEILPITHLLAVVDCLIERILLGVFFANIRHNIRFKLSAKVQILQPNQISKRFDPFDNGRHIGNARKDR